MVVWGILNDICPKDLFSAIEGKETQTYLETVGKETSLFLSVEHVSKTPLQSTVLVAWPAAFGRLLPVLSRIQL